MSAEFLVVGGVRASDSFSFADRATLGTDPGCEVRLSGAGVATMHAVVMRRPEGGYRLTVVDVASEVVVNGVAAVVRRGQYDGKGARLPVSRRVVRRGAVDGISTMTHTRHEGEPGDRPILCTPLTTRGKSVGAFYLERLPNAKRFDDEDL